MTNANSHKSTIKKYVWPKNLGDDNSPYQDFIKFKAFLKKTGIDVEDYDIALPIPDSIQFSDGMNWSAEEVSSIGYNLDTIKNILQSNKIEETTTIQPLLQEVFPEIMLEAAAKLQKLGSKNAITQRTYNAILNPYVDQIFNGIELRSFNFNWKLVPRNQEEQWVIHNIIKIFRQFSLPNTQNDNSVGFNPVDTQNNVPTNRWLSIPHYWRINFWNKTELITSIPRMKPCIISNITVNYTPDGQWSTHYYSEKNNSKDSIPLKGPVPVAYDLSITLNETEIVTSFDIERGF